jgi:DNA-directed RNA polymerase specialized sigma24 family protein
MSDEDAIIQQRIEGRSVRAIAKAQGMCTAAVNGH